MPQRMASQGMREQLDYFLLTINQFQHMQVCPFASQSEHDEANRGIYTTNTFIHYTLISAMCSSLWHCAVKV
ncbi:hypothetical protein SDJN03_14136, partial [Cucurbita argyrosperma subsp. sororia]